jgi:hypothetical protein
LDYILTGFSDETAEDVRGFMRLIQDNEIDQQRELGLILDAKLNYIEQQLAVLRDVKTEWADE